MSKRLKLGLRGKTVLNLSALVFFALAISTNTAYWQSKEIAENKVLELEHSKFVLLKRSIENELSNFNNNLFSLRDLPAVDAITRAKKYGGLDPESGIAISKWKSRLSVIFEAFIINHPQASQVRYIDSSGIELVRVERTRNGAIIISPEKSLQNKSMEPYVRETLKLEQGQTYFSDVSLNREYGVIQQPHVPVFRIATPVQNGGGLIIINLFTEHLFSSIHSESNGTKRSVVDDRGYYIVHDDASKTFGADLGFDYRFEAVEPELADMVRTQDEHIRRDAKHHELDGFQKIYFSPSDRSRYWLLTLHIPEKVVFSDITSALNRTLMISLLIGLLSLLLILRYISRNILTPLVNAAAVAEKLQAGDLTVRADTTQVKDEFHTLCVALNAFAINQEKSTAMLNSKVDAQSKRLSAVIDNIIDGIITIDEKGTIQSFNPAARQIFGYLDEEVIGQNVKLLMPEPYHSEHDGYLAHHIKTGEKKVIGIGREVTGRRKDGSTFPMELAVSTVFLDNVRHFVGITRDISERKRVEQMQKEFVSTVSHELRTPLTSIRGSLGLVLGGVTGELPEKAKALLTVANNNSERLILLINDILDMEKASAGKMQFDYKVINLTKLVQQSIEANLGYAHQLHVQLQFRGDPHAEVMVRVDEKRMAQVMSNLLSNAAKYSPRNDTVEISVQASGHSVRIAVHDHGKGIPDEFKSRIFEKFSQADSSDTRQKGGTGLGLNITREMVQQQGGSISFSSSESTGTTFYVDLPIWIDEAAVEKSEKEPDADTDKPMVLIIEDDKDVSQLLAMMLDKEGYNFHQAFSYAGAVQKLEQHSYDAITLDLMIPGGSGIDMLRQLRASDETKHLPVIVVSAKANAGKREVMGDSLEVVDWLEKPIDEKRLMESLHSGIASVSTTKAHILHVEDDHDIAQVINSLAGSEYHVTHATTLAQAGKLISNEPFDLVLLDIGLPDGSGLDLLPLLHTHENQIPVIIFSALDLPEDLVSQVNAILIKSETDNERLMKQIKSAVNRKRQLKGE